MLIEVTVVQTGDVAYAETPDDAVFAAQTIGREAKKAQAIQGFDPQLVFRVNGQVVRSTTLRALNR